MIYFFHHYELPAIMQQARIQQIIIETQHHPNNDNHNNDNNNHPDNNDNNNNGAGSSPSSSNTNTDTNSNENNNDNTNNNENVDNNSNSNDEERNGGSSQPSNPPPTSETSSANPNDINLGLDFIFNSLSFNEKETRQTLKTKLELVLSQIIRDKCNLDNERLLKCYEIFNLIHNNSNDIVTFNKSLIGPNNNSILAQQQVY